jgi:hypothetical protein
MKAQARGLWTALAAVSLAFGSIGSPPRAQAATVIQVPADYPTIQAAIDAASAGDTVLVAPGTYVEHISIYAKEITVESSAGPETTTIDGNTDGRVVYIYALADQSPVLRGFTITNGYTTYDGGGVMVAGGPALIEGNRIVANFAPMGAGISAYSSGATIQDNIVDANHTIGSGGGGGGIYVSAIGAVKIIKNVITGNYAAGDGGGIDLFSAGSVTVDRNIIVGNQGVSGGGISLGNSTTATVSNNLVAGNTAAIGGGVWWHVEAGLLVNNTIVGNGANDGPAIHTSGRSGSTFVNNVLAGSTELPLFACDATYWDPGNAPVITHNDAWNTDGPVYGGNCGGLTGTSGNVSVDPGFVDPVGEDYHLRADSPLIDAGTNSDAPSADFDGDARPHDGDEDGTATVDIGFDEATDPLLVVPARVTFGSAGVGIADMPETVTVTNMGDVDVALDDVAVDGPNAADFSLDGETCTAASLVPSASCTIIVGFAPQALGTRSATVTIAGSSPPEARSVSLIGTGIRAPSGIAWAKRNNAGPAYTWNGGGALGRTVQSGKQRLHLAYTTPRIGSRWVKDTGPYLGVYYVRSTSGSTWTTPKRVNPTSQHGDRVGLAAAGSRVYVAWVSQKKVIKYSPTAPRVLYVRVNTRHGVATRWKSTIRLTSKTGRVDFPTIAASGYDAYIAYTDSVTGSVRVAVSHDRGATWKKRSLGTTTVNTKEGRAGWPSVAVSGSTVAVAWVADSSGRIVTRVSTDKGATWDDEAEVSPQSLGHLSVAVRGTRVAAAWTTDDEVVFRQRLDGTWGDPVVVAGLKPGARPVPYSPAVTLQDPQRIAVAWAEEVAGYSHRADLRWAESADGGAIWFQAQTVYAASSSSARRVNDWPSILWPSAGTRYVAWNGWTYNTNNFRLYLRKGSGTPVGPTVTAPVWQPDPDSSASVTDNSQARAPTGH